MERTRKIHITLSAILLFVLVALFFLYIIVGRRTDNTDTVCVIAAITAVVCRSAAVHICSGRHMNCLLLYIKKTYYQDGVAADRWEFPLDCPRFKIAEIRKKGVTGESIDAYAFKALHETVFELFANKRLLHN